MTFAHNHVQFWLGMQLGQQLDRKRFDVRSNAGHVRRSPENYFIPDVFVFPLELAEPFRERPVLEWYDAPLPLVVEIWSPSTGDYDVQTKLTEYQRRGDLEIWLIHPFDRTLTAWRRQPDGSYAESHQTSGSVQPVALPNVTVDLDALFD
jgi:Uma2 family endonuclease